MVQARAGKLGWFGVILLACCVQLAVPLVAQESDSAEVSAADVRKALRQLESDELEKRDDAEKVLVEMGSGILPFLPEIDARTSGELKVRLQRIRSSLDSTEIGSFFEASTVELSGTMPIMDAIEAITAQTENVINLQGEDALDGVEVTFDDAGMTFWEAMDSVMAQANLRINAFGSMEGELSLVPGGLSEEAPAPALNGAFRVDAASVQSTRAFQGNVNGQLDLSLYVSWEPRLEPVFMQIPMAKVEAKSKDNQLSSVNPQAAPEIALNYGGTSTQIDIQIERPSRDVTTLESLKGEFVIAVPSGSHKYIFKKFGNGARQSEDYGDVTVTLEGARRNGAVYEMRILVKFGNAQGALDSFRGWILSNEAYLLDPKEVKIENVGLQTYAVTPNAVGIAYLFQINGNPDDYQLVYESPGAITKQTVAFELTDIPLP